MDTIEKLQFYIDRSPEGSDMHVIAKALNNAVEVIESYAKEALVDQRPAREFLSKIKGDV